MDIERLEKLAGQLNIAEKYATKLSNLAVKMRAEFEHIKNQLISGDLSGVNEQNLPAIAKLMAETDQCPDIECMYTLPTDCPKCWIIYLKDRGDVI